MTEQAQGKVLNCCEACGRQYDVTHLASGARVRCTCGARFGVKRLAPHSPRALKCANCGGPLEAGAARCDYCSHEIAVEERRLSSVCPACFARMAFDARYCMECGVEISPQAIYALCENAACPRCKGALRTRDVGATSITECSTCAGIWLPQHTFVHVCEHADSIANGELATAPLPAAELKREGYIPCLSCGQLMQRKNYASTSGVVIDVCRSHGVWLDANELERILEFIRKGGLERMRERQIEKLKEEQRKLRAQELAAASSWVEEGPNMPAWGFGQARGQRGFGAVLDMLLEGLF